VLVGAIGVGAIGSTAASAASTVSVWAGAESSDGSTQVNQFFPGDVTVNVGDTITWKVGSTEFHDVVFLSGTEKKPFIAVGPQGPMLEPQAAFPSGGNTYSGTEVITSGLLNKGDTQSVTFTAPGTYEYWCTIHSAMKGTVTVTDGGAADTQAALDARATAELNSDLANHGLPVIVSNTQSLKADAAAAVAAGAGDNVVAVNRFLSANVTIAEGQTVTWINKDPETPHTVTFLDGTTPPDLVTPAPQPDGPPLLLLNPAVLAPSSTELNYDGNGFLNSGFISNEEPFTNTFSVRFTQRGVYAYICVLHEGMGGTVTVLESAADE
jgi:plastocyanin